MKRNTVASFSHGGSRKNLSFGDHKGDGMVNAGHLLLAAFVFLLLLAALSGNARRAVHVPFRPTDGLFSNVIIPMNMARCYPQYDIVCTGWPDDIRALFPNLVVESDAVKADVPLVVEGTPCYIAQSPVILASPLFASVRSSFHPMSSGGGMFAPAERVMAIARSWWEKELGGASCVVGVHGRAPFHYAADSLDLERHVRLLADEVAEEACLGARVLLASCNLTVVEMMRARFGDTLAWRAPEGELNTGNVDWGGVTKSVTASIALGALIDAVLLSMCDVVVCGASNVVLYASALRPAMRLRIARHLANARSG